MTLYMQQMLTVLMMSRIDYPLTYAWAEREMDKELREYGYLNCGSCPFDTNCNLNHRGACAYGE